MQLQEIVVAVAAEQQISLIQLIIVAMVVYSMKILATEREINQRLLLAELVQQVCVNCIAIISTHL